MLIEKSATYLTFISIEEVRMKGYEKIFYKGLYQYKAFYECAYWRSNVLPFEQSSFILRKLGNDSGT